MMDLLFFGNTLHAWLLAVGIAITVLGLLIVLRRAAAARLSEFADRTSNDWDDLLAQLARCTKLTFLGAVALYVAGSLLVLPVPAQRVIDAVAVIALVVQGALWGNGAISHLVERQLRRRAAEDAASATTVTTLGFLGRVLLVSVLVLLGLDNLGVDITALVAGLGIGGVAVALALQSVLGDLFASLAIVLDKPFVIGDFIIVDDLMGTVEHVGLKTTRIRSLHGEQIIFSNAGLLSSRIRNYKRMQERRVVFALGVTYDTSPDQTAAIPGMIREIIDAQPNVRYDRAHFKGYGAFSLEFETVYYVLDADYNVYMNVQQEINLAIQRRFAAEAIEFAFPTQTLHLRQTLPSLA